jgi:hypothetical protein
MLHIQIWSPDTCKCVIHQLIDDALPGVVGYATYSEAVGVHADRMLSHPGITNPSPQPASVV